MNNQEQDPVKRMADLLRRGATLLAQSCPQCGSPLMKVGDDIYCATCNRRIVFAQEGARSQLTVEALPELRRTLVKKIETLTENLKNEHDIEILTKLSNLLVLLLRALRELDHVGKGSP